jgi:hypothetical protein
VWIVLKIPDYGDIFPLVLTHFFWNPKTGSSDGQAEAVLGLLEGVSVLTQALFLYQ